MNKKFILKHMNMNELTECLEKLKWSKAELARRLGVDPHTISRWRKIPGYAEAYVLLMMKVREAGE